MLTTFSTCVGYWKIKIAMSKQDDEIDWSLTTWEGSRRETLRRWCKLNVRERLQALEEMCDLARQFTNMRERGGSAT